MFFLETTAETTHEVRRAAGGAAPRVREVTHLRDSIDRRLSIHDGNVLNLAIKQRPLRGRGRRAGMSLPAAWRRAVRELRQMLRPESYLRGAALQERLDTLRLYLLTEAQRSWPDIQVKSMEDVEQCAPRMHQQQQAVQSNVSRQILKMLTAWRNEQPPPLSPALHLDNDTPDDLAASLRELRQAVVEQYNADMRNAQRHAFGFSVRVAPSGARCLSADAGHGVFIDGMARMGSVLALYPGVIFYPSDIIRLPTGTNRFKGNEHLILRYDRTLLDASPPSLALVPGAAKSCPLAVGHRVNHPPPGSDANVLACAFDLSIKEVPSELHELLPNVRFQQVEWDLLRKGDEVDRARAIEGTKGRGGLMAALDQMVRCAFLIERPYCALKLKQSCCEEFQVALEIRL